MPENMMQMIKGYRPMLSISDDNVMLKQLEEVHDPDEMQVDTKPLLSIAEDILSRATRIVDVIVAPGALQAPKEALGNYNDQASFAETNMLDALTLKSILDRISCEIGYKCMGGADAHSITMSILGRVSNYSWDSKSVVVLSAFAAKYGEFWHFAQSYTTTQLAKSVAVLKHLPEILERSFKLKPQLDAVKTLIKAMLDINKCIVQFRDISDDQYITNDVAALSIANTHMPIAVYWTIRCIVASASLLTELVRSPPEYMLAPQEMWELSALAHKVDDIHTHLETQLNLCIKHIDERKSIEAYQNLINLSEMIQTDNMKILKALLNPKNIEQPLHNGATKNRVNLDALRRKFVLLLISDLDISQEELAILVQIYTDSRQNLTRAECPYEVVWFPILDPAVPLNDTNQKQLENLQASMPWYMVHQHQYPSSIDQPVIMFIKERWHFVKKPILVVLNPQGQVANPNALHMMWIWRSLAFPFTTQIEEALWKEETWRLELLVDGIDSMIPNWISKGRYICLYGGDDIEWIRKFTNTARAVAQAADISLGMVYVGKSNPKERVRRNIVTIIVEKLSHCWQDLTSVWYFWVRLESMWHSKNQLGRTVENDPIMREIMTMLTFDGSEAGWAVLSRGSTEMTKAKGSIFLTGLLEYSQWKEHVQPKGFVQALHDHLKQLHSPHHCNRLVLPGTGGMIPENVVCSECGRTMERFIMYKCCIE